MRRTVNQLYNHPSVCYYTIFNEGWGQFDSDKMFYLLKELDSSRIIDTNSGWFGGHKSDVESNHIYFKKIKLKSSDKPIILSEFGGYSYKIKEHSANLKKTYGYKLFDDGEKFEDMCIRRAPRTRAYVKIEDGCECRCSYCAISDARGPVRSKPMSRVIDEVVGLAERGTHEIVLTGIETGSYGVDLGMESGLGDLIAALDERHACSRIRLGSMAPELLSEKFVTRVAPLSIMVPHFHVSMQSGSNRVLRLMRRRYSRERALENIERIRALMPRVTFTADLMVGFPGETEEDFLDTVDFVHRARLLDAHVFAYSKRARTPAADYPDQVPDAIKQERSERLIAEKNAVRDSVLSQIVAHGAPISVIFETKRADEYVGHSDSYAEVAVRSDRDIRGLLLSVIPERCKDGRIYGKLLEK
jgi:threonylcarbamoyladenosine tRNA methylthiotransferase MtaB